MCLFDVARMIIHRNNTRYHQDFLSTDKDGYCEWVSSIEDIPWEDTMVNGEKVFILSRTRWLASQKSNLLIKRELPFGTLRGKNSPLESKGRIVYNLYKLMCGEEIDISELDEIANSIPSNPYLVRGAKKFIHEGKRLRPITGGNSI